MKRSNSVWPQAWLLPIEDPDAKTIEASYDTQCPKCVVLANHSEAISAEYGPIHKRFSPNLSKTFQRSEKLRLDRDDGVIALLSGECEVCGHWYSTRKTFDLGRPKDKALSNILFTVQTERFLRVVEARNALDAAIKFARYLYDNHFLSCCKLDNLIVQVSIPPESVGFIRINASYMNNDPPIIEATYV